MTPPHSQTETPTAVAEDALALVLSDPAQARCQAEQALRQAQQASDPPAWALAELVLALIDLREADMAPALARLAQVQDGLQQHPDARAADLLQHLRAQVHRRRAEPEQALALLEDLHQRAAGRPLLDAFHTVMALGTVQSMRDQMQQSLQSFFEGLEVARRSGRTSLEVNALNNLGSMQLDLYNLEDALPLLRRCLQGAQAIGSRRQVIFAAGNLVQCLCAMGQAAEALDLTRRCLIGLIRPDDPPTLQRDEEIAFALLENGLADEAREVLARQPCEDVLTNPVSACRAWLQVRLLLLDGQFRAALALAVASRALAEDEATMPVDRVRLTEITAEAAHCAGAWRLAFEAQHRAYQLKDLLLGRAAKARFLSLQIDHELRATREERDAARRLAQQLEQANATLREQMAANEALRRRLESLALEDPLTGLANRRHLFQAGQAMVEQSLRDGSPVAVALLDLDHFKSVNDRHGHDSGDRVLKAFAALLRTAVRGDDLCVRYGGEEFALVLRATTAATAAERLRGVLGELRCTVFEGAAGVRFACSFSAGVAVSAGRREPLEALLHRADQALYQAKAEGRARVVLAGAAQAAELPA